MNWSVIEHSWSDTGIYAGERRVASLSILNEATEDTQERLAQQMRDDARLIAAAPDLLAGLQAVIALVDDATLVRNCANDSDPDWARKQLPFILALTAAQTAITKATGAA